MSGVPPLLLHPLPGIPEVQEGDDVAALIGEALTAAALDLRDGDVVVVASKLCAKASGRRVPLSHRSAAVLAEAAHVVAERVTDSAVTRIVRTHGGLTLAGAGIDASNTGPGDGTALLLPQDPDRDAAGLRDALAARFGVRIGVVLADTSGRAWRRGHVDYALGCAGIAAVEDLRGATDADGRPLTLTVRAVADEIAAAADLVKGKARGIGAVRVRGLAAADTAAAPGGPAPAEGTGALLRAPADDWFALGAAEAIRDALGAAPGTQAAVDVGIPPVAADDLTARLDRALALARLPGAAREPLPPWHPRLSQVASETGLEQVQAHVVQSGVRLEAPEEFALGLAVARLLVALRSEGLSGRLGARGSRPPHALVLLV